MSRLEADIYEEAQRLSGKMFDLVRDEKATHREAMLAAIALIAGFIRKEKVPWAKAVTTTLAMIARDLMSAQEGNSGSRLSS